VTDWSWFYQPPRPDSKHRWRLSAMPSDDVMTIAEACDETGLEPEVIRRAIRRGRVEAEKDGAGRWMIDVISLSAWLNDAGSDDD